MKKRLIVISVLIAVALLSITATACGAGTCTVSFDSDGGTAVESVVVVKGETVIEPVPPKKNGYTFGGWLYNGEIFDFHETPVENDMTLKAKWTHKEYKVTFIDHDGAILKVQKVFWGESATAPSDPQREGYKFVGWDKDFSAIKNELTVVAKYREIEPEYDLKINGFDTQGETTGFSKNDGLFLFKKGTKPESSLYWYKVAIRRISSSYVVTAVAKAGEATPTEYDYLLICYEQDTSGKYRALLEYNLKTGDGIEFSKNPSTLTAGSVSVGIKITPNVLSYYTVKFVDFDGRVLKTETVLENSSATAPEVPARDGYTFVGWDKGFGKVAENLIVTALYEEGSEETYDVTINGYNTQSATGGFKANEGLFLFKYGQEVGSSVYWHKIAFGKIGGKYSVTAVVATGGSLPQTYEYVLLSYQNDGSGTYGKLLNLGIAVGDELEFSEDLEALSVGSVSVGVKVIKIDPSSYDFSKMLDRVSDNVTSNTIDSLPSTVAGVELTWSSENPDLYTIHQGRGYTNRIHQTHKKQSVKVSLLVNGETYSKTITVDPVLFKEPISPKTAYFSVSTIESYKAYSERYKSDGQIFSDKVKNGIDMINYAFAVPQDGNGNVTLDTRYLSQVMELHSYGVRVILVIDGANRTPLKAMTVACYGDMTRKNFVDNIMNLVKTYNFDGVDIDWEFPGILSTEAGYEGFTTAVDQESYAKLLRDLREAMDSYQDENGTNFILSCAVPSAYPTSRFKFTGDAELGGINDYVDYVNMMSYDLNNTLYTSHVSACYTSTQPNDHKFGCVMGVDMFVNMGLDKDKIIIGCAGYGKAYKITGDATPTGLNSFAELTKLDKIAGSWSSGTIFYAGIKQCMDGGNFTKYTEYDAEGRFVGSYLYNPTDKTFITYDSAEAIKAKCEFAKANGIGIMLWSFGEDATDTVVNAMIDNI